MSRFNVIKAKLGVGAYKRFMPRIRSIKRRLKYIERFNNIAEGYIESGNKELWKIGMDLMCFNVIEDLKIMRKYENVM